MSSNWLQEHGSILGERKDLYSIMPRPVNVTHSLLTAARGNVAESNSGDTYIC
jgi:hypothetical protein